MRTVEQFVREYQERGRSREEVRGIALSTQWKSQIPEVLEEYDKQSAKQAA